MPSVTEILDWIQEPELVAWKLSKGKAFCEKVQAEALRVGKAIDSLVKADLRNLPIDEIPPSETEILSCWQAWKAFKADHPEFK